MDNKMFCERVASAASVLRFILLHNHLWIVTSYVCGITASASEEVICSCFCRAFAVLFE
jgi:hypothetical protein